MIDADPTCEHSFKVKSLIKQYVQDVLDFILNHKEETTKANAF